MMLAIDIGNSNVVIALKQGDAWSHQWRMNTKNDEEAELFYLQEIANIFFEYDIDTSLIEGVVLSSVVPVLRPIFYEIFTKRYDLVVTIVGPDMYEILNFEVPRPDQIGTDLVANAYAGYIKYGGKVSVVDFGTAMTITTVNDHGKILGVSIAPGIKTAMKALVANTAQLPDIPLELPESVLGNNTIHAMQAGILWGYVGMVKEMATKIRSELSEDYKMIATGGLSFIMKELEDVFHIVDRNLTLNGLFLMWRDAKGK
ncbi:MAG: type III pantothenate kinase [Saprospiraceae bacterium]